MKTICTLLILVLFYNVANAQLTITGCTGTGNGSFTSFTDAAGAFNRLNQPGSHTAGDIISISITGDISSEPGLNELQQGSWASIRITPSGIRTLSGAVAGKAMLNLQGADNVTFDGLNTGGNSLTISNTSNSVTAGTATIGLYADATGNTITNCTILGSATGALSTGNIYINGSGGTSGNDNNTISFNNIGNGATSPSCGIRILASSAAQGNDNITINNNSIYNYYLSTGSAGIYFTDFGAAGTIRLNRFYQSITRTGASGLHRAVYIDTDGGGFNVNNNLVGFASNSATGTTTYSGSMRFTGIYLSAGTPLNHIDNNAISSINLTTSSAANVEGDGIFNGIVVMSGPANIEGNTVGAASGFGSILISASTSNTLTVPIYAATGGNACTVSSNIVGSYSITGGATIGFTFRAIWVKSSNAHTIESNNIGSSNINIGVLGNTTANCNVYGIYSNTASTTALAIIGSVGKGNIVSNINNNSSGGGSVLYGIITAGNVGTLNLQYNTINDNRFNGGGLGSATYFAGVFTTNIATTAVNINYNNVTGNTISTNTFTNGTITLIHNGAGSATANISISNNYLSDISFTGGSGGGAGSVFNGIRQAGRGLNETVSNNELRAFSLKVAGTAYLMNLTNLSQNSAVSSNRVTSTISNSASSCVGVFGIYKSQASLTGGTYTVSGNEIRNIAFISSSGSYGIFYEPALSFSTGPSIAITGNTVSISQNNSTGSISGIEASGSHTFDISSNVVTSLVSGGGVIFGIHCYYLDDNTRIYNNRVYNLNGAGAVTSITGIVLEGFTPTALPKTAYVYNNFVSNLLAPAANSGTASVTGMSFYADDNTQTIDAFNNSIYLNASSSGANFSTTGLQSNTNQNLLLRNNIIINTSTPAGSGRAIAYERSSVILATYNATSNSNVLYAGTPAASRLIFYDGTNSDQTLAAYKARVTPRDSRSLSLLPAFVSVNDLHLTAANCTLDGNAIPIPGFTTDIDGNTRDAYTPDIGGDEFTATAPSMLVSTASVTSCDSRSVNPAGTQFIDNACSLIAKVQPSGASPVSGYVNSCVYITPVVLPVFNAEPYVQRHFDIEPETGATTATATVTLYFTDAEFVTFNASNAAFPDLPTVAGGGNADPNIINLRVTQYHGTPTTSPSTPGNYTVAGGAGVRINPASITVSYNGTHWEVSFPITGFSGFYVHTNVNYALPITMNYFRGSRQSSNHLLNWKVTCNSTPKATLTLQRSATANGPFVTINSIDATAARCNQPFDYTDTRPLSGMNYYRLQMADADGKITYSDIVALLNATKGFEIVNIAPNPVIGSSFKLNIASATAGTMDILISDMQGRIVQRRTIIVNAGFNAVDMNVVRLAAGTYNLVGMMVGGERKVVRVVKRD